MLNYFMTPVNIGISYTYLDLFSIIGNNRRINKYEDKYITSKVKYLRLLEAKRMQESTPVTTNAAVVNNEIITDAEFTPVDDTQQYQNGWKDRVVK